MSGGEYAGDDVGAIVVDIGSNTTRVGFAGEDTPRADIPSVVGIVENKVIDGEGKENLEKKYYLDTTYINAVRGNMELKTFLQDGMIDDFDLFEKMMDHIYSQHIHVKTAEENPVLMSEASWNVRSKREKICEIMFEKYKVPAFFLVKNSMLAAFGNGRSTGLVLDVGAAHASAVPIQDGYVLQQAIVREPIGGDYITNLCKGYFEHRKIDIVPPYLVASKQQFKEDETPKWTPKQNIPPLTESWKNYAIKRVIQDYQSSVLQVSTDSPYDKSTASTYPIVHHEFPNGLNFESSSERFLIPEKLFNPHETGDGIPDTTNTLDMAQLVTTSVGMCDIDLRAALYGTLIVTGGSSLITGFTDRLQMELSSKIPPSMRLKLYHTSQAAERRFGAWIGGSILASLGTFQQMWISQSEYRECGKAQVDRKCP